MTEQQVDTKSGPGTGTSKGHYALEIVGILASPDSPS